MTTRTERSTRRATTHRWTGHSRPSGRPLVPASLGTLLVALMALTVLMAGASVAGAGTPTVLVATNASFGTILTTDSGMALYTLDTDHNGQSTCHGACAAAWPPLTVPAGTVPSGGPGVTGTVAAAKQANGTYQATYNGDPVYTFVGDTAPGQVTGNGMSGFFVVVTQSATTTTTAGGAATGPSSPTGTSSSATPQPAGSAPSAGTPTASGSSGPGSSAGPSPASAAAGSRATGGSLAFTGPGPWLQWLLLLGLILVMGGATLAFGPARRARGRRIASR